MRALAEARAELQRVSQERDELRKQLSRIDSVQTATIALPDERSASSAPRPPTVPSLEDLMAALGDIEEPRRPRTRGHLHQHVQATRDTDDSEEMIAPRLVFPEQFARDGQAPAKRQPRPHRGCSCCSTPSGRSSTRSTKRP